MNETRRMLWLAILLGTASLAAGFAWGRFRAAPDRVEEPDPMGAKDLLVEKERDAVFENEREAPLAVGEVPAADREAAEAGPPPEEAGPPFADSSLPDADVDRVGELVESFANATPEELARFPWDRRVRAALDKLRASSGAPYAVDSGLPPRVLADLLSKLLGRAGLPLADEQQRELERLAAEWEAHVEGRLADLGDDALALERELTVVAATDDFLEEVVTLLDDRQRARIESWTPPMLDWPPFLSPLTGAPVRSREVRAEEIPELRDGLSRELAREFGLDPADGDRYAAKFIADIRRFLEPPDGRERIVERVVAVGEAWARLSREILAHPAVDAAARRRIRASRHWMVPVVPRE